MIQYLALMREFNVWKIRNKINEVLHWRDRHDFINIHLHHIIHYTYTFNFKCYLQVHSCQSNLGTQCIGIIYISPHYITKHTVQYHTRTLDSTLHNSFQVYKQLIPKDLPLILEFSGQLVSYFRLKIWCISPHLCHPFWELQGTSFKIGSIVRQRQKRMSKMHVAYLNATELLSSGPLTTTPVAPPDRTAKTW